MVGSVGFIPSHDDIKTYFYFYDFHQLLTNISRDINEINVIYYFKSNKKNDLKGVVSSKKVWLKEMYITKSTKKKVGGGLAALSGV